MEVLEVAGRILVGWVLCSILTAAGWSCVMGYLRRKEQAVRAMQLRARSRRVRSEPIKPAA